MMDIFDLTLPTVSIALSGQLIQWTHKQSSYYLLSKTLPESKLEKRSISDFITCTKGQKLRKAAYRVDKSQGLELVAVPCPVEGAVDLKVGVDGSGGGVEIVVELCKVMDPPVILQGKLSQQDRHGFWKHLLHLALPD